MEGLENVQQEYQRRRLKRKCPDPELGRNDPAGNLQCDTSNQPAPEPLAQLVVANGVSWNDHDAIANVEQGKAEDDVELPTELEQANFLSEQSPAHLVAIYRNATLNDPLHRASYKVLWTRMYRCKNSIKTQEQVSQMQRHFLDLPGPLLSEDRIKCWLALQGCEQHADQVSKHRDRAAHRPTGNGLEEAKKTSGSKTIRFC